jgi:hypothetical protein
MAGEPISGGGIRAALPTAEFEVHEIADIWMRA